MQHLQRTLSMIYSLYMRFLAVHSPSLHHTSTFTFLASHFYTSTVCTLYTRCGALGFGPITDARERSTPQSNRD